MRHDDLIFEKRIFNEDNIETIKIFYDNSLDSPRGWSNYGEIVLPDNVYHDIYDTQMDQCDFSQFLEDAEALEGRFRVILALCADDYGTLELSTKPFDGGGWEYDKQIGIIGASYENIKMMNGDDEITDERLYEYLEGEIKVLNAYLSGKVYGFDYERVNFKGEVIISDSCSGFYSIEDMGEHLNDNIMEILKKEIYNYDSYQFENN